MEITGRSIIGFDRGSASGNTFKAFNPETGEAVEPAFYSATDGELDRAESLADAARIPYGKLPGKTRAIFLRKIADNIEALGDTLIQRASLETALPNQRFVGERARTCGQLRMFADLLDEGSWVDARVDLVPARHHRHSSGNPARRIAARTCRSTTGISSTFW